MARINLSRFYRENLRLNTSLSERLRKKLTSFFNKYKKKLVSDLNNEGDIKDGFYLSFHRDLTKILTSHSVVCEREVNQLNQRIRSLKKQDDYMSDEYRDNELAKNVTQVTDTTRNKIKVAISLGLSEGLPISDIAKNIVTGTAFSKNRAKTIARTETGSAMNLYHIRNAKRSALRNPVKMWLSAMDDRARQWHKDMNRKFVDVNADFTVLTPEGNLIVPRLMAFPCDERGGASNVINCRCTIVTLDEEDIIE